MENTHNFAGGAVTPIEDLRALRAYADSVGVRIHLDGARIWNAHVATGVPLAEYGAVADVLAVCLSKGLGAPIGSAVVGDADAIAESRIWRKRMGGGMRQVGILAAAGLHALDHHVERLADDHAHARLLAEAAGADPASVDSNIVVVDRPDAAAYVAAARDAGLLIATVGPHRGPAGHPPRRRRRGRRARGRDPRRPLNGPPAVRSGAAPTAAPGWAAPATAARRGPVGDVCSVRARARRREVSSTPRSRATTSATTTASSRNISVTCQPSGPT